MKIRVEIEGYDPRDLLAGLFITFALAGTGQHCPETEATEWCVCYLQQPTRNVYIPFEGANCGQRPAYCDIFLRGTCKYSRFTAGAERYSIPEQLAPALLRVPPNSSVTLSVDNEGNALVEQMFVEDETVETYAERVLRETPTQVQIIPAATPTP
jgi:hypothetical protein